LQNANTKQLQNGKTSIGENCSPNNFLFFSRPIILRKTALYMLLLSTLVVLGFWFTFGDTKKTEKEIVKKINKGKSSNNFSHNCRERKPEFQKILLTDLFAWRFDNMWETLLCLVVLSTGWGSL
jgi:hypothetical protein